VIGNNLNGNPMLGPLANNGGPNKTHALLPDSPAIDAGNPTGCVDQNTIVLTTDQRGFRRPVDGPDADTTITCDIGAVEFTKAPSSVIISGPSLFFASTNQTYTA